MVIDPVVLSEKCGDAREKFRKDFINKLKPFRLKQDQESKFEEELLDDMDQIVDARKKQNEQQVESATMKVVASPVVGFAAWFALAHSWIIVMGGAIGGWVEAKK